MQLKGKYRLSITGDISKTWEGRSRDHIGYFMQRLLTGEAISEAELESWGIVVREVPLDAPVDQGL